MTYCVGILLKDGLVFASDSRTNAGVDHVAAFRKLTTFGTPGERFMVLLSAGNLATTQAVVTQLNERLDDGTNGATLSTAHSMFEAATIVGAMLRAELEANAKYVEAQAGDPYASFILGGQIAGRPPRLFQIYSAGNFIEASPETPFFQIGETKYGKPILDRTIRHDTNLKRAAMAALVSFDSAMRSNLGVAPPIDLLVYRNNSFKTDLRLDVGDGDTYFGTLRRAYGQGIVQLFDSLTRGGTITAPPHS
jgi:putative proteasome-type protease